MLLTGLITLLIAIPLYSLSITSVHFSRITAILLLYSAAIAYNGLYVLQLDCGLGMYSGLFNVTAVRESLEMFLYIVGAMILTLGYNFKTVTVSAVTQTSNPPFPFHLHRKCRLNRSPHFRDENEGLGGLAPTLGVGAGLGNQFSPLPLVHLGGPSATGEKGVLDIVDQNKKGRVDRGINEYPLIILFTIIGASFLISSGDMVSMYLSIELQSFAVYILAAIYRNSESATRAGLKYFLLGALSSALILLGSSLIYAYTGLTNFDMLYRFVSNESSNTFSSSPSILSGAGDVPLSLFSEGKKERALHLVGTSTGLENSVEVLGILIIAIGFLFKVAAAPLHNWAPDVYDGVPTVVTTWLTIMPKISLFMFLLFLTSKTISMQNGLKELFLLRSSCSLIIGRIVGLGQSRIKRLLAYSTISHVGFLLLAISVYSEDAITAFLFYLIQYSLTNLNVFMILLAFGFVLRKSLNKKSSDISFISSLHGQFQENPILVLSFAISLFSMAGIPPLLGFFAKYFVLYSAIQNGYYFISLMAILTRVISARYYLRIIRVLHTSKSPTYSFDIKVYESIGSVHRYLIRILTLLILLYMFNPSLLLNSNNLLALSYFSR